MGGPTCYGDSYGKPLLPMLLSCSNFWPCSDYHLYHGSHTNQRHCQVSKSVVYSWIKDEVYNRHQRRQDTITVIIACTKISCSRRHRKCCTKVVNCNRYFCGGALDENRCKSRFTKERARTFNTAWSPLDILFLEVINDIWISSISCCAERKHQWSRKAAQRIISN